MSRRRRKGGADEEVGDLVVLAAVQQDAVRIVDGAARRGRSAGSRRSPSRAAGSARRSRGPACRTPSRARPSPRAPSAGSRAASRSRSSSLLGREFGVVGTGVEAVPLQPAGHSFGVGDGQAVDDAANRASAGGVSASHASRSAWLREPDRLEPKDSRASGPRGRSVRRRAALRCPRRHGRSRSPSCRAPGRLGGRLRIRADPAVVRAEVVAPVRDAVRFVDDEQPDAAVDGRQRCASEVVRWPGARARSAGRRRCPRERAVDARPTPRCCRTFIVAARTPSAARHRDLVAHERRAAG